VENVIERLRKIVKSLDSYTQKWAASKKWKNPTPGKAVQFVATEAGEALKAIHKIVFKATNALDALIDVEDSEFTRNNANRGKAWAQVDAEVGDTLWMCLLYFKARGIDFERVIETKLKRMDRKRSQ